jgi:amphiphysin
MSWKGFTKAVARLPQVISTKAGYASETVDTEYIDIEDKFKGLESCARKLHEDARKFKESLAAMLEHQRKFSETLIEMFQPISTLKSGKSSSQLDLVSFLITKKITWFHSKMTT